MLINYTQAILKKVVNQLVVKDYESVVNYAVMKRCMPDDIALEISYYPGVMTRPPDSAYEDIYIVDVEDSEEKLVHFDLWFDNQKGDLEIILLVNEITKSYSFWDILVP